jgi:arsenate reductase
MESRSPNVILFVCVENTFRSIMSEAIFNAHAPKGWIAESAGVKPVRAINPLVIELLNEIGIQVESKAPKLVTPVMIERARRVVTFGCLDRCPVGAKEKAEDWPIPGSTDKTWIELRSIRDELLGRVLALIERLALESDH